MRADFTDITVVMDRSGSMSSCKSDAEGGLNEFIQKQKQQTGTVLFTLVQFNQGYECFHAAVPIQDVPHCTLEPHGNTALLDAVGRAISETGNRLEAMPEADRPGLVVFVILTDGEENSSREYSSHQIREMITHQQTVYNWQFTYLGANQDAFAVAKDIGIAAAATANFEAEYFADTFAATSANIGRMSCNTRMCAPVHNYYTDTEREQMTGTAVDPTPDDETITGDTPSHSS